MKPSLLPVTVAAGLLLAATSNLWALPPREHSVSGVVEAIDCGSHTIALKSKEATTAATAVPGKEIV